MKKPTTLGELKKSPWTPDRFRDRTVKDEIRENLIARLERGETLFPGIVGYEDTVTPQLVNALLSRHHLILLGLRGQAKSRILRGLVNFLDEEIPVVAGCEINDNPYRPICRACQMRLADDGEKTPVAFLPRDRRYVEKLATPDVTVADIVGDLDPIRAARGGHDLSSELTIHYGLLPRAHRGIFAINELPDLAGKIQVALFNIMQEGDVQIKGYPVRLPLDVLLVFSANPEDYTARGKIITPLKDRIGSEIRTHYPLSLEEGVRITEQESWVRRYPDGRLLLPRFITEVVEEIAFRARENKYIDKRSGVSQRLPISCLENAVSNAERRAIVNGERTIVPRPCDVYAARASITGKLELEYEGELRGGAAVATALIKEAVARTFARSFSAEGCLTVVDWFDAGGILKVSETAKATECITAFQRVPGLLEAAGTLGVRKGDAPGLVASACEFVLEGLHALQKVNRSEKRGYFGVERKPEEAPPPRREAGPRRRFDN